MRIIRITVPWVLLLSLTCLRAAAQQAPPWVEVFVEGGGSFLSDGTTGGVCSLDGCSYSPIGFSREGRLSTGARFGLTRHDALEASYAYSPNPFASQVKPNRLDVIYFNYVRYFAGGPRLQPFATAGVGANRFSGLAIFEYPSANGFHFAWNFGAGTDIVLQRHLALRLELRDYVGAPPSFLNGTGHDIVPSAGIVFRFK